MSNVHFIWWGPCPGPEDPVKLAKAIAMPSDVANSCAGHQINFWCDASQKQAFTKAIAQQSKGAAIAIQGITTISEAFAAVAKQEDNQQWFADADDNLRTLVECKAFSAVKDLLSLFILYCEGGFYFDTTTVVTNQANLTNTLAHPPADIRTAQLVGMINHQVGVQTGNAIAYGSQPEGADFFSSVPLIDVWALYAPPLNATLELIYKSYVSRCNRLGLFPGGTANNFKQLLGTDLLANDARDTLIGQLIIRSMYDGIIGNACAGDLTKFSEFIWQAAKVPVEKEKWFGDYALTEVGINKFYGNTWRTSN